MVYLSVDLCAPVLMRKIYAFPWKKVEKKEERKKRKGEPTKTNNWKSYRIVFPKAEAVNASAIWTVSSPTSSVPTTKPGLTSTMSNEPSRPVFAASSAT